MFLTQREAECLSMNYQNYSAKEISVELNLSTKTVQQHLYNIKNKTGVVSKKH